MNPLVPAPRISGLWLPLLFSALLATPAAAMNLARIEARVDSAVTFFGVSGKGVLIAVMDRGIDWKNADFRNLDGTTRIQGIFDLTDDAGAFASNNSYGKGTIYTRGQIDSANAGLRAPLATRDAVGHGTTTAGITCGSGRNSPQREYRGVAPEASLLVIKITSDGAPAHDSVAAEAPFYDAARIPIAINYARDKAAALHMPCVMVLNLGSIGGPTDGTSELCRTIDSAVGAGIPGLVFVNGTGDDGGIANHAGGDLPATGDSLSIHIHKGVAGPLVFDLWYDGADLFDIGVISPFTNYGPYPSPPTNDDYDSQFTPDFTYYHYGGNVTPWLTTSGKREVYIQITGGVGDYTVQLFGADITSGHFNATINPSNIGSPYNLNFFTNQFVPGSIGDFASCLHTVIPTDYNVRTSWVDIDGFARSLTGEGTVGQLWLGSSVGPTFDYRLGVDVAAPGNSVFTTYNPTSWWATFRFNLVNDGGGLYGRASAVSAANPFIAGIVALMLQRNPNLDAAQVRQILRLSARTDSYTGAVPNNIWGYGKVNAFAALARVIQTTAVSPEARPTRVALSPAGPNPFRISTVLEFELPKPADVKLVVLDVLGREVAGLVSARLDAGTHRASWRPGHAQSGIYFARLNTGGRSVATRLLYLR